MRRGHETYWICLNRACEKTLACEDVERELETRVCDCGRLMKRAAHATVFSYLNFLRETASRDAEEKKEGEETPCERGMWAIQKSGERLRWS
jgi:hypothetical protein